MKVVSPSDHSVAASFQDQESDGCKGKLPASFPHHQTFSGDADGEEKHLLQLGQPVHRKKNLNGGHREQKGTSGCA